MALEIDIIIIKIISVVCVVFIRFFGVFIFSLPLSLSVLYRFTGDEILELNRQPLDTVMTALDESTEFVTDQKFVSKCISEKLSHAPPPLLPLPSTRKESER